jgi:hypothetical protein
MGADSVIAFYGIRLTLDDDDIEAAETKDHPYMVAAQRVGLQTFWGRERETEPYFLMIGHRLAWLGAEHHTQIALDRSEVVEVMEDVQRKLSRMGARDTPRLHLQYHFDE